MSDPACVATVYGPCAPYMTIDQLSAVLCGICEGFDLTYDGEDPPQPNTPADVALLEQALLWASRWVYEATGQRYVGCCPITIRPCRRVCGDPFLAGTLPQELISWLPAIPFIVGADENGPLLVNCWYYACDRDPCSCPNRSTLILPFWPVRDVLEIVIGGVALDPAAWTLRPGTNLVVRLDGGVWPTCNDQDAPDDDPGVWSVRFRYGLDLPPEALPLLGAFACDMAKMCRGGDCQLAPGTRVVSRPGVEYAKEIIVDPEYASKGLTGFAPVDDWIIQMRGGHTTIEPRIYVPGRSR